MNFGYLSMNHASGSSPGKAARALEDRGFDSIWVPEHSHIPTSRKSPYPGGCDLPEGYWNFMDPFTSLAAAAEATDSLILATGVCLILEHDLLDLACTAATLDVLSEGRLLLGVGVGWNAEELANHRPDLPFRLRYRAMRERIEALRTIWREETPVFEGRWERFSESWVYPKPVQATIPFALGNAGPTGIGHAAEYADHWCPIDGALKNQPGRPDISERIGHFRRLASEAGRDPSTIGITLFAWGNPPPERLDQYADLGVERVVVGPPTFEIHDEESTLKFLDRWASAVSQYQ